MIIYYVNKLCQEQMISEIITGIKWKSEKSLLSYFNFIKELGIPNHINKNPGGSATWDWKDNFTVKLRDTENPILGIFPLYLLMDYKNVEITDRAIKLINKKINRRCNPIILDGKKTIVMSNSWDDMIYRSSQCMQIASGVYCDEDNEIIIDKYLENIKHQIGHL